MNCSPHELPIWEYEGRKRSFLWRPSCPNKIALSLAYFYNLELWVIEFRLSFVIMLMSYSRLLACSPMINWSAGLLTPEPGTLGHKRLASLSAEKFFITNKTRHSYSYCRISGTRNVIYLLHTQWVTGSVCSLDTIFPARPSVYHDLLKDPARISRRQNKAITSVSVHKSLEFNTTGIFVYSHNLEITAKPRM